MRAGRVFRRLCDAYDALFIVNDRPELAIACGADGVHLGQDDADPLEVRRADRRGRADRPLDPLARSRSTPRAASTTSRSGPVHATPTKPEYAAGRDRRSCATRPQHARFPFFAIGGIDAGNVEDVVDAGAERVAVVRAHPRRRRPGRGCARAAGGRGGRGAGRRARVTDGRAREGQASASAAARSRARPRAQRPRRAPRRRARASPARTTSRASAWCRWCRASDRWWSRSRR